MTSLRLQVVKNGADDPTKAVPIVAPVKITFHCNRENVFKDFRVLDSICIFPTSLIFHIKPCNIEILNLAGLPVGTGQAPVSELGERNPQNIRPFYNTVNASTD